MWYPEMKWQFPFFYLLSLSLSLSLSLPDYTNCVSILAVRFHTREGPIEIIELFKLHHSQPEIKCSGFVDGNSFLMIENTSIAKLKILLRLLRFCCAVIMFQLIILKNFSVINDIFSKICHQNAR